MKKLLSLGPIFIVIAAILWALDGVLRISLYSLPPAVIVFYEHFFGFIVLLFISFKWLGDLKKMTKREWIAILAVSLFSGALGTIFYTSALQQVNYLPFSVVVLLQQQLQPLWAIAAAAILLREKITKRFLALAAVALVSVYFVTFKDLNVNLDTGTGTIMAAALAIGAGFMWGTSTAISKFVLKRVNFLTATAQRFFFAPLFALLFISLQGQTQALFTLTFEQIRILLIITFSTGMLALAIYYYGLKRVEAKISSILELAFPAAAIFIDYFLYHKVLTLTQILGVIVLVFVAYMVTKENKHKSASKSPKAGNL
ncbi:MAG: DMT family transporter [Candidatus Levybacteria bacterium]|nr:DMT family transporter [Candidatus Levybacteria bacterium]